MVLEIQTYKRNNAHRPSSLQPAHHKNTQGLGLTLHLPGPQEHGCVTSDILEGYTFITRGPKFSFCTRFCTVCSRPGQDTAENFSPQDTRGEPEEKLGCGFAMLEKCCLVSKDGEKRGVKSYSTSDSLSWRGPFLRLARAWHWETQILAR